MPPATPPNPPPKPTAPRSAAGGAVGASASAKPAAPAPGAPVAKTSGPSAPTGARPAPPASGNEPIKRKRRKSPNIRIAALNITSMMDLVLNLLLFFVLTASFATPEGSLSASLPPGAGGGGDTSIVETDPEPTKIRLIIVLRSVGETQTLIQIEGAPASPTNFDQLYTLLDGMRYDPQRNPNGTRKADDGITIRPDRSVRWNEVVEAFNAVIRAKYTDVGFAPAGN